MDAILCLKRGKARGIDLVHTEFLCHMGFCALDWLLLSNCLDTLSIPAVCWHAKVVEILKPKKPADEPRATDQSRYSASRTNIWRGLPWRASTILAKYTNFITLWTSALAPVCSAPEYAAAVWAHSTHTKAVDVVLNDAMRLISGTLKSMPTEMLPVISGILPASIRRNYQVLKLAGNAVKEDSLVPPALCYQSCSAPQARWTLHVL